MNNIKTFRLNPAKGKDGWLEYTLSHMSVISACKPNIDDLLPYVGDNVEIIDDDDKVVKSGVVSEIEDSPVTSLVLTRYYKVK